MNPFHLYLERQLTERFKKRPVVVWYDPRKEFEAFVDALPTQGDPGNGISRVAIGDQTVSLVRFEGSFFGIKTAVEPLVAKDEPDPLMVYLPGASRDRKGSVLMELEMGGECFEWQLKRLARFCLLENGDSDGIIDNLLSPENNTYLDVVGFLTREGGEAPSLLIEEKALLKWAGELILKGEYTQALTLISERRRSFWADRTLERQSQWTACRLMARLGDRIQAARKGLLKAGQTPARWIDAYCDHDGWHRVDLAQQQMEAWAAKMTVDPEAETALEKVRQTYEDLLQDMAVGFMESLENSGWIVSDLLQQTDVYQKMVAGEKTPVAYFLVDAMRFAMAREFVEMLPMANDVTVKPAAAAWPTITPVGMAALLPGASEGFSVVESGGKLAARIDNVALADISARLKFFKARVPGMNEMPLEKLLQMSGKKLAEAVSGVPLLVVRSQEIDSLGEIAGGLIARQVMDTMVGNVVRAVRKLADCGMTRFVVTADHGHLFTRKKQDAFKTDSPGGKTVEIHRRCWIGQGGITPPGTVRLSAFQLGYDSDLEFVFPKGIGVFKTGGDLGYHHGGLSLQEIIIPVISFRMGRERPMMEQGNIVVLSDVPEKLTNRTFGIKLEMGGLFNQKPLKVRPLLLSQGVIVGKAGMTLDADFEQDTACVILQPEKKAGVAMILENDDCKTVRVMIQDPATDAVLAQSDDIPVSLGTK